MTKVRTGVLACAMVLAAIAAFAQAGAPKMTAARPAEAKPAVSDALMQKENALLASLAKKDFASFKKMMMPGSWAVDEGGFMTVEDLVKTATDPKANFSFEYKVSDMKVVTVDPSAAIVTYRLDEKGSMMGQPFPPIVYASTTWANHGGNWMAVFHQESTAAPPAKK